MVILTQAQIAERYNVTQAQIDRAERLIDMKTGEIFYQVSSQTTDETYELRYNKEFHRLSCQCKAAQNGIPCWHKRAATAAQHEHRQAEYIALSKEAEMSKHRKIQAEAQAHVEAQMVILRKQRDEARKDGSFSILK